MAGHLAWFSTRNGKLFTRSCVGLSAFGIFNSYFALNGPLLDKVRSFVQVTRVNGEDEPLSDDLQKIILKVLDEGDINEKQKEKLKFFSFIGHDLFHCGGKNSPWGAIIGVPFTFDKKYDVGRLGVAGRLDKNWFVEDPEILEAISLSENAKKFCLLREIYSCDLMRVIENALIATLCLVFPAEFSRKMNIKLNAFVMLSLKRRVIYYAFYYLCGFFFYKGLKDPLSHIFDKDCDEKVAKTRPEYLAGGIEYYEKTLRKNKSLRKLLSNGTWVYSENGNENYILLAPKLPISKRLDFLIKLKDKQNL